MTTDELIATLARSPEPVRANGLRTKVAIAVIFGFLLGLVLIKLTVGFRPDIGVAAPIVAMKAGLSALIATFAGGLALSLAKPVLRGDTMVRRAAAPLITVICAALAIGAITLYSTDPSHRFVAFTAGGFPWCIAFIPVCGLPTAALLMWALRDAAPTRLALAGAGIGAFSGSVGAVVYAMACVVDSVPFVTTWYVGGIAVAAAVGAILGHRLLRW